MNSIIKFNDNVDTDQIIPSQYLLLPTIEEVSKHAFEGLMPDFLKKFNNGDVLVSGNNFGCGSSREQAPQILKQLGVTAIIAKSFARIFFRNSINIGLPVIVCQKIYDNVKEGDKISLDLEKGQLTCNKKNYSFNKYPEHLMKIVKNGGLIAYLNKSR